MASGNLVVVIHAITVPNATTGAPPGVRAGGSTPAELFPGWDFDASTEEFLDFHCSLEGYTAGGLSIIISWVAASATTGGVVWAAGIRRHDSSDDLDASHSYSYIDAPTSSAPGTNGVVATVTLALTHSEIDGLVDGEDFVLRLKRRVAAAGDDMTGDAKLTRIRGVET